MKRFDYMLIHSPAGVKAARERAAATVPAAKRDASKLRSGLGQLGQIATKIAYGTPLALSAFEGNINPDVPPHSNKKTFSNHDKKKTLKKTRVGLWDLGAWLGGLARIIEAMNNAQDRFVFYDIKAIVPAGIIGRPERIVEWISEHSDEPPSRQARKEIKNNIIANDFFKPANAIRQDLRVDYIVGITPSMIAGEDEDEIYWNHFSTFEDRVVLVSTYELRRFAREGKLSFEAFLIKIVVAELLVALFWNRNLGFHENRGCVFDYDPERFTIIDKVRNPKIEPACMKRITPSYRAAAEALMTLIRDYNRT